MSDQLTLDRLGSRGGSTASLSEGQSLLESGRDDPQRIRSAILRAALRESEWHADLGAHWPIHQPSQLGAQVNALARMGLLEKRNRFGEVEHRKAQAKASHGRASYVWRLTPAGVVAAEREQAKWEAAA